jgi:hypothetical protein
MNQHWRQISKTSDSYNDGTEISLSAFNWVCFKCGGKNHKASDCPENGKGGAKDGNKGGAKKPKEKRKCYRCGKVGHILPNWFMNMKPMCTRGHPIGNW